MKKYVLSAVLLALLPFLTGSVSKEPARTLLPIEDDFLNRTASAPIAQTDALYMFRYIGDAGTNPRESNWEQLKDIIAPDVNIYTQVSGIVVRNEQEIKKSVVPVVISGKQTQAQALFNAIGEGNKRKRDEKIVQVGVEHHYSSGLSRYYIHVGRSTLYRAYRIIPLDDGIWPNPGGNCFMRGKKGPNGELTLACDIDALEKVRECLLLKVSGIRLAPDHYE
jgi:hypothetical protein